MQPECLPAVAAPSGTSGEHRGVHGIRVGVCEDDDELRSVLVRALRAEEFEVQPVVTGHDAVRAFTERPPDVVVLDIGLPDADGRDVCQALRAQGVTTPVLFLTARGNLTDRLSGFHAGGDDYLAKPFALSELIVRVQALLRRAGPRVADGPPGEVRLDPATHSARVGDRTESLTPTEFRLLAALLGRRGRILRRRELILAAWPDGAVVQDNTLDAFVLRLRRKLRDLGSSEEIRTHRGVGYSLR
jgi:two-component system response regulator MprA